MEMMLRFESFKVFWSPGTTRLKARVYAYHNICISENFIK